MWPAVSFAFASLISACGVSGFCLCREDAMAVGQNFGQLISNYTAAFAHETLASTFSDQTDSVITLIDSASQPQVPLLV